MGDHPRVLLQLFGKPVGRLLPAGIRFGPTIYAPNLTGTDAQSDRLPDGLDQQMEQALSRMGDVLDEAGASADNVARVTAYVGSPQDRNPVYGPWDRLFPDPQDRPAFKVLVAPLPAGVKVRLDVFALAGARRQRIDIEGVPARDPTVKVGNWVVTSRVHGTDPRSGEVSPDLHTEIRQAFANVATLLDLAGAAARDLSQVVVFARDAALAQEAGDAARQVLPEFDPAQLTVLTNFVPPGMHVMVEAIGVRGREGVREVFGSPHSSPIPDAAYAGELLFGGAITGEGADFAAQLQNALHNMQRCLQAGGVSLAHVGQVSVYMRDLDCKPLLNDAWSQLFPDPGQRPPHKYVPLDGGDPAGLVQLQVFAVRGAQRQVLEIPGMAHADPMSMGARLGDLVFSSRVVGTDTNTGETPTDPDSQARTALRNVRTLLEQAGATTSSLTQVNAFINDAAGQAATHTAWREVFSDASRPEPKLNFLNARLPGSSVVRFEVLAAC